MELSSAIEALKQEALTFLSSGLPDEQFTAELKKNWLGKDGKLKPFFARLREVSDADRPKIAANLNEVKSIPEQELLRRDQQQLSAKEASKLEGQYFDLALPGKSAGLGFAHPIARVERKILAVLKGYGFKSLLGPEVETEYYCFDALNIPKHHPARDMQDTFYTDSDLVLRTHTTSVSARSLEGAPLPVKSASFGRVYRNETEDASHQAMFHQFDLIWIEEGLTLAHLMGLITEILKALYGKRRKIRFVPKFYPYTEPSIGPQIDCTLCKQQGCPACGGSGWVTVAGAGMMHRNVLLEFKYDPDKVGGLAFGLGTSRLASQFFNFDTLRSIYENDLRVLRGLS